MAYRWTGVLLAIVIVIWGSGAALSKLSVESLSGLQALLYLTFFASIVLFALLAKEGKLKNLSALPKRTLIEQGLLGWLGVFLYYFCYLSALSFISAQETFIINYTWPIFMALFMVPLLGERPSIRACAGIVISFIGVVITMSEGGFSFISDWRGSLLALAAGASFGLYSVLGKRMGKKEPLAMTFVSFFSSFLLCAILVVITGSFEIPSVSGWLYLSAYGVLNMGFSYYLWFKLLSVESVSRVANWVFLTPFVGLVWIYFLIGEPILMSSILGLLVILSGILLSAEHHEAHKSVHVR